jgi:hypothetical protein
MASSEAAPPVLAGAFLQLVRIERGVGVHAGDFFRAGRLCLERVTEHDRMKLL